MTDDFTSRPVQSGSKGWTLSRFALLLAMFALLGAGLADVSSTDIAAKDFATAAYGLLVAGVVLSIAERMLGALSRVVPVMVAADPWSALQRQLGQLRRRYDRRSNTRTGADRGRSNGRFEGLRRRFPDVWSRLTSIPEPISERVRLPSISGPIRRLLDHRPKIRSRLASLPRMPGRGRMSSRLTSFGGGQSELTPFSSGQGSSGNRFSDRLSIAWIRRSIGMAIPLTFLGGLVLIGWWWRDSTVLVPMAFLGGWLLAIVALLGVWVSLSSVVD